ncbi:MAG: KpsF/GutQ family sugar-phosphate isomerase [Pyrinomonadaceae bacterium]|nr:KpsF/GutQ family sugar-phosphate isomerase [Pyrinomonadaceae bacterium]
MTQPIKSEQSPNAAKVVELLRLEASAIEAAAERLDAAQVEAAIEMIRCCDGKVIVMGVGKSGVIAQKIAQTMTSTGTIAVFVHPSDAMHGSLGVVTTGDVVIALSNSGETDELVTLLPAIRKRGVGVISILGNLDSTLARQSDVVLDASVDKEACPLNLAPTTSTTVALSIGDAIAMTLMESKGLTQEDFASNHPAGRLGKRLTLRVRDLMHPSPNVSPDAGWLDVVKSISDAAVGAVNVIDSEERLIGIVTDGDLRRTIQRTPTENLGELRAIQMMTKGPTTVGPDSLAYEALRLMEDRPSQISVLPVVVEDGRCVGLLRLHDIVKAGL